MLWRIRVYIVDSVYLFQQLQRERDGGFWARCHVSAVNPRAVACHQDQGTQINILLRPKVVIHHFPSALGDPRLA